MLVGCAQLVGIHDDPGDASIGPSSDGGDDGGTSGCLAGLSDSGVCPSDLVAGVGTTCVLSNGLWCWGQFLPTMPLGAARPTQVAGASPSLVALATTPDPDSGNTEGAGCYLQDGSAMCWGPNDVGELGRAAGSPIFPPVVESSTGNLTYLVVGGDHVCAAAQGSNVACTGEADKDEIGSGSANASCDSVPCDTSPVSIPIAVSHLFAAGGAHTCVSPSASYPIACWGANSSGQLGNPGAGQKSAVVPVLDGVGQMLSAASALALGTNHTCAIVGMMTYCWGDNASGELGIANEIAIEGSAMAVDLPPATSFVQIAAGGETTCAIDGSGGVWCWGSDRRGTAGQAPTGSGSGIFPQVVPMPESVAIGSGLLAQEIAVGYEHACAVVTTGDIYCWGDNTHGELGDGETAHDEGACGAQDCSYIPVRVKP